MKTREEILATLRAYKPELMKKYPIQSLALFGSYARNEATEESDIDVMVEFNGNIGIGFIRMALELEDVLKNKVDLVSAGGVQEYYLQEINKDRIYV
ncbi:MAG: nucleotidyltransferase family protein [Bacteroidetes bacterium]|nr:nucleotidyltransferase family protein [Bacteroidota bacterium]